MSSAFGCALAGFLLALLIFGDPWHLPPNWGNIPRWLAVLVASVGGWIALSQLRQQQAIIQSDIERSQKRDDLLDGQLRELADRERARQREQAEKVNLSLQPVRISEATDAKPGGHQPASASRWAGSCRVTNGSGRPVRRVACRLNLDGREIRAVRFAILSPIKKGRREVFSPPPDDSVLADEYLNLLALEMIIAYFTIPEEIDVVRTKRCVIRFTDDADRRWELDANMHLIVAPDAKW